MISRTDAQVRRPLRWMRKTVMRAPAQIEKQPLEVESHAVVIAPEPLPGANLVGYLQAEMGLGEAARKLGRALDRAGVSFSEIAYQRTESRQHHPFEQQRPAAALYDTNIICLNTSQLRDFLADVGIDFFAGRYSIGVWFWETTVFPEENLEGFRFVDEVWVSSEFVRNVISAETALPVFVAPLPVEEPREPHLSRADLDLPEGFLYLFSFDYFSVFERKNPLATVEAFKQAFAPGEGPVLVLKSINGHRKRTAFKRLIDATRGRPDIHVIDGYVSADQKNAMMAACDCYVSLHRSEGFGLTMAEAMSYARPVIATGYSGNLEFMNDENGYLVPYTLTEIPGGSAYPAGAHWADPDLIAAATLMRRVYEHQDEAWARGKRGHDDILRNFSLDRTADFVAGRLSAARERRASALTNLNVPILIGDQVVGKRVGAGLAKNASRWTPRSLLRRFLMRALWPYLADQHKFNTAVLDALTILQRSTEEELRRLAQLEAALKERDTLDEDSHDSSIRSSARLDMTVEEGDR